MRLALDLRDTSATSGDDALLTRAVEADGLGLWGVVIGGPPGVECLRAARVARETSDVGLVVWIDGTAEHPHTIAEELSVLDHLSARRVTAVIDGPLAVRDVVSQLLAGHVVDGGVLTPPPAQTAMTVWSSSAVAIADLTGDLEVDRTVIDGYRDAGTTHLLVSWTGPLLPLARHLATRAVGPDFPQLVADMADRLP